MTLTTLKASENNYHSSNRLRFVYVLLLYQNGRTQVRFKVRDHCGPVNQSKKLSIMKFSEDEKNRIEDLIKYITEESIGSNDCNQKKYSLTNF